MQPEIMLHVIYARLSVVLRQSGENEIQSCLKVRKGCFSCEIVLKAMNKKLGGTGKKILNNYSKVNV